MGKEDTVLDMLLINDLVYAYFWARLVGSDSLHFAEMMDACKIVTQQRSNNIYRRKLIYISSVNKRTPIPNL
jgi:hypothetical protein